MQGWVVEGLITTVVWCRWIAGKGEGALVGAVCGGGLLVVVGLDGGFGTC